MNEQKQRPRWVATYNRALVSVTARVLRELVRSREVNTPCRRPRHQLKKVFAEG